MLLDQSVIIQAEALTAFDLQGMLQPWWIAQVVSDSCKCCFSELVRSLFLSSLAAAVVRFEEAPAQREQDICRAAGEDANREQCEVAVLPSDEVPRDPEHHHNEPGF